jgi:methionyl-tRNA formyltransferase
LADHLRTVLLGLTGFGNAALQALDDLGAPPVLVVTRHEPHPHPYYETPHLADQAAALAIPVAEAEAGEALIPELGPDLLLVATYHRVLPRRVLAAARLAVNLHPSLLPRYRGASPCHWVIRDGEAETGLTAHRLDEQLDAGPILWQERLAIRPFDTHGSLRRRLADLTTAATRDVVARIAGGGLVAEPQDEARATWCRRLSPEDRVLDLQDAPDRVARHLRALTPWPGALVSVDGTLRPVLGAVGPDIRWDAPATGEVVRSGDLVLRLGPPELSVAAAR